MVESTDTSSTKTRWREENVVLVVKNPSSTLQPGRFQYRPSRRTWDLWQRHNVPSRRTWDLWQRHNVVRSGDWWVQNLFGYTFCKAQIKLHKYTWAVLSRARPAPGPPTNLTGRAWEEILKPAKFFFYRARPEMLFLVILHYKMRGRPAQAQDQPEPGPKTEARHVPWDGHRQDFSTQKTWVFPARPVECSGPCTNDGDSTERWDIELHRDMEKAHDLSDTGGGCILDPRMHSWPCSLPYLFYCLVFVHCNT
jgi:hypothetical protein